MSAQSNNEQKLALTQIELGIREREVGLLREAVARSKGRRPGKLMPRIAAEGLFDIFKSKKPEKPKELTAQERAKQLLERVQAHSPKEGSTHVDGLLALLKNSANFEQTIKDVKACLEAETAFQEQQLKAHSEACKLWVKLGKDADLKSYYFALDHLNLTVRPVVPAGFSKKFVLSQHKSFKDRKYLLMHNHLQTVCIDTPFDEHYLARSKVYPDMVASRVEDPWFMEFPIYCNTYSFSTGPLNQFKGEYSAKGGDSLKSAMVDLLQFCASEMARGNETMMRHWRSPEFKAVEQMLAHEAISADLVEALDDYTEPFFEHAQNLVEDVYQYYPMRGLEMVDTLVDHLAVAYLKT